MPDADFGVRCARDEVVTDELGVSLIIRLQSQSIDLESERLVFDSFYLNPCATRLSSWQERATVEIERLADRSRGWMPKGQTGTI